MFDRILIYGYGTMTSAMLEGWLASGLAPGQFTIFNPRVKPVPTGVTFASELPAEEFDAVVLGFKPHMLADIAPDMQKLCGPETTVLSVLAGVELSTLAKRFPRAGAVVRFMPNLAVALGKSPNALIGRGLDDITRGQVADLAERLGSAEWIADEAQFDLVTALGGSGPGFVYRFIDALASGAGDLGLDRAQAERLAVQMVEGAVALATKASHSPRELAALVASPGGMTQKGLYVLDRDDALACLVAETLRAARDRGRELAEKAR